MQLHPVSFWDFYSSTLSSTGRGTLESLYFLYKLVAMVLTKKDTKAAKTIGSLTYFSNNIKHHFEPRGYKVSSGFTKKSFQNPDASSQVISFKLSLSPGPQSFRCFPCLCCGEKSLCHIVIYCLAQPEIYK